VPPEETGSGQQTVLVVDDEEDLLQIVREVIEQEGFRVLTARSGDHALDLLRSGETPCLILLDMKMPGMSAQEFRSHQLADPRIATIPVVGFTGVSNGELVMLRTSLSSYLRKPVNLHQLLETVAHYCSDPDHIDTSPRPTSATG
jgi:two-component system response regulator MprA